jgi:hypothetical protein
MGKFDDALGRNVYFISTASRRQNAKLIVCGTADAVPFSSLPLLTIRGRETKPILVPRFLASHTHNSVKSEIPSTSLRAGSSARDAKRGLSG